MMKWTFPHAGWVVMTLDDDHSGEGDPYGLDIDDEAELLQLHFQVGTIYASTSPTHRLVDDLALLTAVDDSPFFDVVGGTPPAHDVPSETMADALCRDSSLPLDDGT